MISIRDMYNAVRRWAKATAFRDEEPELIEASDFGQFYGFMFKVDNIYNNAYWCIDKKTYRPSLFLPVQDVELYNNRIKIDIQIVEAGNGNR